MHHATPPPPQPGQELPNPRTRTPIGSRVWLEPAAGRAPGCEKCGSITCAGDCIVSSSTTGANGICVSDPYVTQPELDMPLSREVPDMPTMNSGNNAGALPLRRYADDMVGYTETRFGKGAVYRDTAKGMLMKVVEIINPNVSVPVPTTNAAGTIVMTSRLMNESILRKVGEEAVAVKQEQEVDQGTGTTVRASGIVTSKAGFAAEADKLQPRIRDAFAGVPKREVQGGPSIPTSGGAPNRPSSNSVSSGLQQGSDKPCPGKRNTPCTAGPNGQPQQLPTTMNMCVSCLHRPPEPARPAPHSPKYLQAGGQQEGIYISAVDPQGGGYIGKTIPHRPPVAKQEPGSVKEEADAVMAAGGPATGGGAGPGEKAISCCCWSEALIQSGSLENVTEALTDYHLKFSAPNEIQGKYDNGGEACCEARVIVELFEEELERKEEEEKQKEKEKADEPGTETALVSTERSTGDTFNNARGKWQVLEITERNVAVKAINSSGAEETNFFHQVKARQIEDVHGNSVFPVQLPPDQGRASRCSAQQAVNCRGEITPPKSVCSPCREDLQASSTEYVVPGTTEFLNDSGKWTCKLGWCLPQVEVNFLGASCPDCSQILAELYKEDEVAGGQRRHPRASGRAGRATNNTTEQDDNFYLGDLFRNQSKAENIYSPDVEKSDRKAVLIRCCFTWRGQGCRFGSDCRYSHDVAESLRKMRKERKDVHIICERLTFGDKANARKFPCAYHG